MKLLFDACVSPRLVRRLADVFSDAAHVFDCGEIHGDDKLIWDYALQNGYAIVSKDGDFQSLSLVRGAPPKVIWLRVGNAGTSTIERLVRDHLNDIGDFERDPTATLLVLSI